ncbi:hypothetical protein [Merismopedia glauca]|uniref:Uncharacterized protein n=1 Tax=Merismopedia glauca CCAP 1448/3 TaxID=1296344 RepID=A0A2T1C816_9CYAN|nr:hypothetical protein [Merismopedia glauca]PSB04277.1 hypothetical protein C7B64_04770 [Merismopedia glauca CCAP 1448/3]
MKAGEIIRVIVFYLIGAILVFVGQPLLYRNGIIAVNDVPEVETWVSDYYTPAAAIVFGICLLATIIWLVITAISKADLAEDIEKSRLWWWLIGLLPVISICAAIALYKEGSGEAQLSLAVLFVLDFLWLYWLTTASSTPGLFMFIPPLARQLRGMIGAI